LLRLNQKDKENPMLRPYTSHNWVVICIVNIQLERTTRGGLYIPILLHITPSTDSFHVSLALSNGVPHFLISVLTLFKWLDLSNLLTLCLSDLEVHFCSANKSIFTLLLFLWVFCCVVPFLYLGQSHNLKCCIKRLKRHQKHPILL
jgi:hypothetical protein